MSDAAILTGYRNTIFYAVLGTAINMLMTIAIAYPLSKKNFRGRGILTVMCMITMFFSGGMIPTFLVIKEIGLYNSYWALLLPKALSVWNMFLLRNYFQIHSTWAYESAQVDGCLGIQILWQIVSPLSKSILAVLVIFYVVGHWNAYFDAILYLDKAELYPLQVILRSILLQGQGGLLNNSGVVNTVDQMLVYESMKYAVIIVASLPVLIMYPILQKYFDQGIMVGSIKGWWEDKYEIVNFNKYNGSLSKSSGRGKYGMLSFELLLLPDIVLWIWIFTICQIPGMPMSLDSWQDWTEHIKEYACSLDIEFSQSHSYFYHFLFSAYYWQGLARGAYTPFVYGSSVLGIPGW